MARKALAYFLFGIGHVISIAMTSCEFAGRFYFLYNKFMMWSVAAQGENDNGPWKKSVITNG